MLGTQLVVELRLLSEAEFHATFVKGMADIKGQEHLVHPDGVPDLEPYLLALEPQLEPLAFLPDLPPAAVYHAPGGRFDHVLYRCNRSNVYLVLVVATREGEVHGHFVLDLAAAYGVPDA